MHLIETQENKTRYYTPNEDNVVLWDHATQFFDIQACKMYYGHLQMEESTRKLFLAIGVATDNMPLSVCKDLNRCLHVVKNWETEDGVAWLNMSHRNK